MLREEQPVTRFSRGSTATLNELSAVVARRSRGFATMSGRADHAAVQRRTVAFYRSQQAPADHVVRKLCDAVRAARLLPVEARIGGLAKRAIEVSAATDAAFSQRSDITPTVRPNKEIDPRRNASRRPNAAPTFSPTAPHTARRNHQLGLRRRRPDLRRKRRRAESGHAERDHLGHPRRVARRADHAADPSFFPDGADALRARSRSIERTIHTEASAFQWWPDEKYPTFCQRRS